MRCFGLHIKAFALKTAAQIAITFLQKKVIVGKEKLCSSVESDHGLASVYISCGHYTTGGGKKQYINTKKLKKWTLRLAASTWTYFTLNSSVVMWPLLK